MQHFASGDKRNYYGKSDVIVYRLNRNGISPAGQPPVFGANVTMLLYGDAFWPTYTTGDNTGLVATDSMKNFIQSESLNFIGCDLETYCLFLAGKFMDTYPQTEGIQVRAMEIPYTGVVDGSVAFAPCGPERAMAQVELRQGGQVLEARSGIHGFKLLRLGGSAFTGFVRDQYTTLPEIHNRPLHMWLDLEWLCGQPSSQSTPLTARVREMVHGVFHSFESGSIQQVIYQIGMKMLAELPAVAEVRLEANNRTWDTVVEQGAEQGAEQGERGGDLGIFTDARPPFGCLGLTLRR
jgi:urate oxidase / 2-oxo-4-hydroxy-4-carboxy-5-ureidoimidazoline decarboxylase